MDAIKEGMLASAKAAGAAARLGESLFGGKQKFNSQICTTKEQSERLLALGLKKETADMIYVEVRCTDGSIEWSASPIMEGLTILDYEDSWPPAWSLGRLLELIKHSDICHYNDFGCIKLYIDLDDFETCINMISYMVKEGYFNKEYLV